MKAHKTGNGIIFLRSIMDTLKIRPRKVVVCTPNPLLYTHIDMCLGENVKSKIKMELQYLGVGKPLRNDPSYHDADLLFLDCALQDVDPMELAQHLKRVDPDLILILLVNNAEEGMKGYEMKAFQALRKDHLYEDLKSVLDRLMRELGAGREILEFQCSDRTHRSYVDQTLYAEAVHHAVVVYYIGHNMEPTHIFSTLTAVEEILVPYGFYRINHSFVINMAYVDRLNHEWVTLANGKVLSVGKNRYRDALAIYEAIKGENTTG